MSNLVLLVAVAPPMGQWGSYLRAYHLAEFQVSRPFGLRDAFSPSNYNRFSALCA